jgi:hypothetical protein
VEQYHAALPKSDEGAPTVTPRPRTKRRINLLDRIVEGQETVEQAGLSEVGLFSSAATNITLSPRRDGDAIRSASSPS